VGRQLLSFIAVVCKVSRVHDGWSTTAYILGYDESILHQINPRRTSADVVESISRLESLVDRMMHYC